MKLTSLCTSLVLLFNSEFSIADQLQEPEYVQATRPSFTNSNVPVKNRVAIIGAGAGGSSTAYHLSKFANGDDRLNEVFEIDVFESNTYIGGRTTTVNAFNDPRYPVEVGGSIFVKVNHILYNLTQDFALSHKERIDQNTGSKYDLGIWDGSSFVFTVTNDDDDDDDGTWRGWWKGYFDIAKLIWKYGLSPVWTQRAKNDAVSKFLRWYDEYFPIASLTHFADHVGLTEYIGTTGQDTLARKGVGEQFSREIIQSSTRVNYAQNLDGIHGLETMVCMAIEGAMAVDGGNWQIFDEAVKRSGANVHLNTTVTHVVQTDDGRYRLNTKSASASVDHDVAAASRDYDTIVLASPYQFANISFNPPILPSLKPEEIDYVTQHVTLFASPYRPSPSFFGLENQDDVPDSILTTLGSSSSFTDDDECPSEFPKRGKDAVGPTRFWSLSTLRVINMDTDEFDPFKTSDEDVVAASKKLSRETSILGNKEYLYKIFSPEPMTAEFLSEIFGWNTSLSSSSSASNKNQEESGQEDHSNIDIDNKNPSQIIMNNPNPNPNPNKSSNLSTLPSHLVSWHYTKTWLSYPYLPPTTSFAPILLAHPLDPRYPEEFAGRPRSRSTTAGDDDGGLSSPVARADRRNARGVWYTSGVESFISTMETSALMGRNVARIVVDGVRVGLL